MQRFLLFVFISIQLTSLLSCKERKIRPTIDEDMGSLEVVVSQIKEDSSVNWSKEDVDLVCLSKDKRSIVMHPKEQSKSRDDHVFNFKDPLLNSVASCSLEIRVNPERAGSGIVWSSSHNAPGLLYITNSAIVDSLQIALQAIKTYDSKGVKKIDPNCFTAKDQQQKCLDRRLITLSKPKLPWMAVVSGHAGPSEDKLQEMTFILTDKAPLKIDSAVTALDISKLQADLTKPQDQRKYAWIDFATEEKSILAMNRANVLQNDLAMKAIQPINFKPLHIVDIKYYGFDEVNLAYLNKFDSAHWFVLMNGKSGTTTGGLLVGGSSPLFYSESKPYPETYLLTENVVSKIYDKKEKYAVYITNLGFFIPGLPFTDPCNLTVMTFIGGAKSQWLTDNMMSILNFCKAKPEYIYQAQFKSWTYTLKFYLEGWHEQVL